MNQLQGIRKSVMLFEEVYFWTATITGWKHLLKPDKYKQIIINSLSTLSERECIKVFGFVIMDNHIHLIWEMLKKNGKEMPQGSLLKFTAHAFLKDLQENHPMVLAHFKVEKQERDHQFWMRDPLAVRLYSREMCVQKLEYIHNNPLHERWNLAERPEQYAWSSAAYYELNEDKYGFLTHYMERF